MTSDRATQPFIAIIGTPDRATFANTLLHDITEGFRANNLRARKFLLKSDAQLPALQKQFEILTRDEEQLFLVDLNGNYNTCLTPDRYASLRFTYLLDHPFRHAHKFAGYEAPLIAGIVDATHKDALADIGRQIPSIFTPHAGPPHEAICLPMAAREIDVLFVGNISPILYDTPFKERTADLPAYCISVIDRAVDLALEEQLFPYEAFKAALVEKAPQLLRDTPLPELREMFIVIETLLASRQRFEALKALARIDGLNIHLVGNIEEVLEHGESLERGDGVTFHGHKSFDEVLAMMGRSKIIINANFTIVGGSHERIWQGMAHGCLVLTNDSLYIRSCFEDGTNILLFPEQLADLENLLNNYLDQPEKIQDMVNNASVLYRKNHTWEARTRDLSSLFRSAH